MVSMRSSFVPAASIITSFLCESAANAQNTGPNTARAAVYNVKQKSVSTDLTAQRRQHSAATSQPMVDDYKITILSDMIVGLYTVGEWGFSALIEITSGGVSKRFLFDTGAHPQTVLANAKTLNINICDIQDVILSHNHWDHTTGLDTLRSSCKEINPDAFKNAYVAGEEIFWPRINSDGSNVNYMVGEKGRYEAQGGTFILNSQPNHSSWAFPACG